MLTEQQASQARKILRELRTQAEQVELAAWVSFDGFVLAVATDGEINTDRIGAMCASLLALSRRAAKEVEVGQLRQVILGGDDGIMLLLEAGKNRALTLSTDNGANLGRILLQARQAAKMLDQLSNGL